MSQKRASGASIGAAKRPPRGFGGGALNKQKRGEVPLLLRSFFGVQISETILACKKTTLNDQKIQLTQTEKNRQQTKKIKVTKLKKKDVTKKYEKKRKYNSQTNKNGKTNKSK